MDASIATETMRAAMVVILKAATPTLLLSMFIGLIIAIFQAATQIHEQTLTFVPKLFVTGLLLLLTGSWILTLLKGFLNDLYFADCSQIGGLK